LNLRLSGFGKPEPSFRPLSPVRQGVFGVTLPRCRLRRRTTHRATQRNFLAETCPGAEECHWCTVRYIYETAQYSFHTPCQDDTGPSMKINVVVIAPEMAVSTHFMDENSLFSSEPFSRLYFIASLLSLRINTSIWLADTMPPVTRLRLSFSVSLKNQFQRIYLRAFPDR
jgi:hypothetical protein